MSGRGRVLRPSPRIGKNLNSAYDPSFGDTSGYGVLVLSNKATCRF